MKSSSALLLLALVILLGAAGFWAFSDDEAAPALATRNSADETDGSRDSELGSPASELAEGESDSALRRGDASETLTGPLVTLDVHVATPNNSPIDDTLTVFAVSRAALGGKSHRDWLASPEGDFSKAPVESNGTARLETQTSEDLVLLLDGKYLFLDEPLAVGSVQDDQVTLRLEPRLGAYLSGEFTSSAGLIAEGTIALMGMSFTARGGRQNRSIPVRSERFEFRAVDTKLTWMLLPELEPGFADSEIGLELTPGEDTTVTVALLSGATVRGIVKDEKGQPLAGATVKVANDQPWMPTAGSAESESDAQGEFVLTGLAPGTRVIQAQLEGRLRTRSDKLTLADGEKLENLELVLKLGAAIRGTIRYPDGKPAVGAQVKAEFLQKRSFGGFGRTRRQTGGEAETDETGTFAITGLAEGRFTLRAQHEQAADENEVEATWRVTQENVEGNSQAVELVLSGPVPFTGRVVDDLGESVTEFTITARSAENGGPRDRAEFTDDEGRFTFAKSGAGDWRITATAEGHSRNDAIELKLPGDGTELLIVLARTSSVSGRVVDATGTPVSEGTVKVAIAGESRNPWAGPSGPSIEIDAGGGFLMRDLKPGNATLTANADGWADSEETAVELPPGEQLKDVLLTLRVGGRIVGSVLTPEGDPIVGRRVTWGQNSMGFGSSSETKSAGDGSFEFTHVTPGEWSVTAAPSMAEMGKRMSGGDAETAWVDVMGQLISETVTIVDGETVEVYLGGEPRVPVRIVGSVMRGGEPLGGAQVFAVSEGSAIFQGMKTVRTEPDGSYSLEVDRPGAYVVSAREGAFGVEVTADIPRVEEAQVDLFIPLGSIGGFIERPDGTRSKGIRMRLQREDGLGRMRFGSDQATTDEQGRYQFDALEPGLYTVRANIAGWNGRADARYGTGIQPGVEVLKDSTTNGIDFELEEAGTIEGLVEGTDGAPIADASVFFRDSSGVMVTNISGTKTDGGGRFKKTGLAPGDYTLSVRASELASEDQITVHVSSGESVEARLAVEMGTRVRVKLEDAGGDARRARIEVFDKDDREVGGLMTQEDVQRMFNEGTSSIERVVGPLAPGRYTVRATTLDGQVSEKKVRLRGRSSEKSVRLKLEK